MEAKWLHLNQVEKSFIYSLFNHCLLSASHTASFVEEIKDKGFCPWRAYNLQWQTWLRKQLKCQMPSAVQEVCLWCDSKGWHIRAGEGMLPRAQGKGNMQRYVSVDPLVFSLWTALHFAPTILLFRAVNRNMVCLSWLLPTASPIPSSNISSRSSLLEKQWLSESVSLSPFHTLQK